MIYGNISEETKKKEMGRKEENITKGKASVQEKGQPDVPD